MKKLNYFILSFAAIGLIGCDSAPAEETTTENPETEIVEDEAQEIITEGYEGTIQGPTYVNIRNTNHIDLEGNSRKTPLIEIDDDNSFSITITTKTLDSLRFETENSSFDVFVKYEEESDKHFIAKTVDFMDETDTSYIMMVFISNGTKNFRLEADQELKDIETAKMIVEYALTYKPK